MYNHGIIVQTCRNRDTIPEPDGTGELHCTMHSHRAPRCGPMQLHQVPLLVPRTTLDLQHGGDTAQEGTGGMIGSLSLCGGGFQQKTSTYYVDITQGGCLSVAPSTVNGTDLGAQEWMCVVFLIYGIKPPYMPRHCCGYRDEFSIYHLLYYKKDVLVVSCHNKLCDRVADLSIKSLTPTYVSKDPLINPGRAVWSGSVRVLPTQQPTEVGS